RVDVVGTHELPPVVVDARDAVLLGDALPGGARSVGDGRQLDTRLLLESGDVPAPCVLAGADEAHANGLLAHGSRISAAEAPRTPDCRWRRRVRPGPRSAAAQRSSGRRRCRLPTPRAAARTAPRCRGRRD